MAALTLQQIGVPFTLFEAQRRSRSLEVGASLLPCAVRALLDLGLSLGDLTALGHPVRERSFLGHNGQDLFSEDRGAQAGYDWPEFMIHYGAFCDFLRARLIERSGADCLRFGYKVRGYANNRDGSVTAHIMRVDARMIETTGALLLAADGVHSALRAEMRSDQAPVQWDGLTSWRGLSQTRWRGPERSIGFGTERRRVVLWPMSDITEGATRVAWLSEQRLDPARSWETCGWFRRTMAEDVPTPPEDPVPDWLDLPDLVARAPAIYEVPLIDRPPLDSWTDGRVALLGDAAHPMRYGLTDGLSQAILDARALGAALVEHGLTAKALQSYDKLMAPLVGQRVLDSRHQGPGALIELIDAKGASGVNDLTSVLDPVALRNTLGDGRDALGLGPEVLNASPPVLSAGAQLST